MKAASSRKVLFEAESVPEQELDEEEDDISEDDSEEEEEDIFNAMETSHSMSKTSIAIKQKNSEDKRNSRSTSIIDTMIVGNEGKGIFVIENLKR